ncbi:Nucleolar MIF4G domain-containing protein 1 [Linum grandiflorum]
MTGQSRREKRKEARQGAKQRRNDSWLAHQKSKAEKFKAKSDNPKRNDVDKLNTSVAQSRQLDAQLLRERDSDTTTTQRILKAPAVPKRTVKEKHSLKRKPQTGFEEFLDMDMKLDEKSAQHDLEVEKRLAKKLKVKDNLLMGMDDGLNALMEGKPSPFDSDEEHVPDAEAYPPESTEDDDTSNTGSEDEMSSAEFTEEMQSEDVAGSSDLSETLEDEKECEEEVSHISSLKKRRRRKKSKQNQDDLVTEEMQCDDVAGSSDPSKTPEDKKECKEEVSHISSRKKRRRRKKSKQNQDDLASNAADSHTAQESLDVDVEVDKHPVEVSALPVSIKYIAPHLRSQAGDDSENLAQTRRRVRGLLNRLSESNIESVTGEMTAIFRSLSRSVSTQIISDEVLAACSGGPRGNEQYAAVFAAFVAGMGCAAGMDFGAKLMAALAKAFEDEYCNEDNLSLRNLTLLLSNLYIFGVCSSDLIYDFLMMLSKRLTEVDVSTILTVLQCCGMKLRGDDPAVMKNFIQSVQDRVNELKASSSEGEGKINGRRMEFMLETICDIKNNKKRPNGETSLHTRIKNWLKKLGVEGILLRGLKWSKLLDPEKKGQWWLSGDVATTAGETEEVANTIDKEVLEAQKMLELAACQRMNTDTRKAIFCIIMSGEDYVDAFEKLLRLNLKGEQDREIMRVLVQCCLKEKVFNKYYTVLASKLCKHEKNHKYTLQYCIRDHFKELDSMPLPESLHLAKFVAEMVVSFSLSLSVVKIIDFDDAAQLTAKRIKHFQMLFEAIFEYPDKIVWNSFTRLAIDPELESFRHGMEFFIREYVVKSDKALARKFKVAKKALGNMEGVLM